MLKLIYRAIILISIFAASIYYFSRDIKEVVFRIDNTTVMEEATFPLVTIKTGNEQVNLLHGYSSNINANMIREAVTPLDRNQTFEVLIDQKLYDIKKLNYEVREFFDNNLIETDSISVFEDNGDVKSASLRLKKELTVGKEYAVKVTLITSGSKKLYYYHRVKVYENAYLSEKLSFVMEFHNAIRNKSTAESMIKYLEPKRSADNTSLSYVNINSSFDLVSWGNLRPKIITQIIPTVREIDVDTGLIELDYIVSEKINGTNEFFRVNEFFRIRYTRDRMYLLNYERKMEAFFDSKLASISKNQLKLGISSDYDVPFISSDDKKKLAFVRDRALWLYNLEDNEMTRVFSFRQDNTDYIRDIYNQHNVKIVNMDPEGNIDFIVYGYMNRGQYEGRVAVILYQYIRTENRIEELVYIPVDESYQTLKENLGEFAYVNAKDVFYFNIFQNLYAYNLITKELREIASNISIETLVYLEETKNVVWQEYSDPKKSKRICILNLETGQVESITAPTGYNIRLLEMIDSNIIYGYVKEEDIATLLDGRVIIPMNQVLIASVDRTVLKEYMKTGYYVYDVEVRDNVVELYRVQKIDNNNVTNYIPASVDYIMNQVNKASPLIGVTTRVTEVALTELYLSLPKGFNMSDVPNVVNTINTVITVDPTLRLHNTEIDEDYYYPYVMGEIEGRYSEARDAIMVANRDIGVVLNNNQQLVWERRVRPAKATIPEFASIGWTSSNQSIESCIEVMLSLQGVRVRNEDVSVMNRSIFEVLLEYSRNKPIRITGITLEEALYYVSTGRPVLALTDQRNAVLIYGYDAFNITVYDPKMSGDRKIGIQDATQLFKEAGNVFISYLE